MLIPNNFVVSEKFTFSLIISSRGHVTGLHQDAVDKRYVASQFEVYIGSNTVKQLIRRNHNNQHEYRVTNFPRTTGLVFRACEFHEVLTTSPVSFKGGFIFREVQSMTAANITSSVE